jgi:hypothetical protein
VKGEPEVPPENCWWQSLLHFRKWVQGPVPVAAPTHLFTPILTLVPAGLFMLGIGLVTAGAGGVRTRKGQGVGSKAGFPDLD